MAQPFLAEIKIVGFNFAPPGWAFCDGQILPINQNQSLYSLLGTTYGGDGETSFALPDMRARVPLHPDAVAQLGQKGGASDHVLTGAEMPAHGHAMQSVDGNATAGSPVGNLFAKPSNGSARFAPAAGSARMHSNMVATQGGGQGHNNMQPFLGLAFCIALQGLFPSE